MKQGVMILSISLMLCVMSLQAMAQCFVSAETVHAVLVK